MNKSPEVKEGDSGGGQREKSQNERHFHHGKKTWQQKNPAKRAAEGPDIIHFQNTGKIKSQFLGIGLVYTGNERDL